MPIQCICATCGAGFTVKPAVAKLGKGRYCSAPCRTTARRIPTSERFWKRVNRDGPVPLHAPDIGPCWPWTGARFPKGYGAFPLRGVTHRAHRWSWQIHHGQIPKGLFVCHRCDNPPCVRPSHLFLGTPLENIVDRDTKGRQGTVRGSDQPGAGVTEDDVREMRRLWEGGTMQKTLVERFGLSPATVHQIVHRKRWRHVE